MLMVNSIHILSCDRANYYYQNLSKSVSKEKLKSIFKKVEHAWSYISRSNALTRNILNASLKSCHRITLGLCRSEEKILSVITKLKLFSIGGALLGITSIPQTAQKILKNARLKDSEGVALATLSMTLLVTDLVDSLVTFTNALLVTLYNTPNVLLSSIGTPAGFGLLGLGSISRMAQLSKTSRLFREITNQNFVRNPKNASSEIEQLRNYLTEKLGSSNELELKNNDGKDLSIAEINKQIEKKKLALMRAAPEEAVNELENLLLILKKNHSEPPQVEEIAKKLMRICTLLKKKMVIDAGNILANLIGLIALILFLASAPASIPFLLLAGSFALRIGLLGYQDLSTQTH